MLKEAGKGHMHYLHERMYEDVPSGLLLPFPAATAVRRPQGQLPEQAEKRSVFRVQGQVPAHVQLLLGPGGCESGTAGGRGCTC